MTYETQTQTRTQDTDDNLKIKVIEYDYMCQYRALAYLKHQTRLQFEVLVLHRL